MLTFLAMYYTITLIIFWLLIEFSKDKEEMVVLKNKMAITATQTGVSIDTIASIYAVYMVAVLPITLPFFILRSVFK